MRSEGLGGSESLEAAVGLSITPLCAPEPSRGKGPVGFGGGFPCCASTSMALLWGGKCALLPPSITRTLGGGVQGWQLPSPTNSGWGGVD